MKAMKKHVPPTHRDASFSETDHSQKSQGLNQAKRCLWQSVSYCFLHGANGRHLASSMTGREEYTESYERFLGSWEDSMNAIYSGQYVLSRSHLIDITRLAVSFIAESPHFRGVSALERHHMKNDVSYQMAMYYFFKKKMDWVRSMENTQ